MGCSMVPSTCFINITSFLYPLRKLVIQISPLSGYISSAATLACQLW